VPCPWAVGHLFRRCRWLIACQRASAMTWKQEPASASLRTIVTALVRHTDEGWCHPHYGSAPSSVPRKCRGSSFRDAPWAGPEPMKTALALFFKRGVLGFRARGRVPAPRNDITSTFGTRSFVGKAMQMMDPSASVRWRSPACRGGWRRL
jgi:hypothetical protein